MFCSPNKFDYRPWQKCSHKHRFQIYGFAERQAEWLLLLKEKLVNIVKYFFRTNSFKKLYLEFDQVHSPANQPIKLKSVKELSLINSKQQAVGLENLGNTCYINSAIQALYQIELIRELSYLNMTLTNLLLEKLFNSFVQLIGAF